jgi:NAD-dependent oxidoreductase involved in siderophore biosynthesis
VFLKDHPPTYYLPDVLADRRFLAEARHAFLIRRPGEIAASNYALYPGIDIHAIGLETRCARCRPLSAMPGGTLQLSSTQMTS